MLLGCMHARAVLTAYRAVLLWALLEGGLIRQRRD
jgi:hypothetical protein